MTLTEAMAAHGPVWLDIWLPILFLGAFIVPLALLIWRQSRLAGVISVVAGLLGAVSVDWLYQQFGYVKLLGLPHLIVWTPLVIYLVAQIRRSDMPVWPRRVMAVVVVTILISLAFDYVDVIRYALGERSAPSLPAEG